MSTIRPLATIAVLAVLGVFLALKITEGPSVALQDEWAEGADESAPAWPVASEESGEAPAFEAPEFSASQAPAPAAADPGGYPELPALPAVPAPAVTTSAPSKSGTTNEPIALPNNIPQANYGQPTIGAPAQRSAAPAPPQSASDRYGTLPAEPVAANNPATKLDAEWPLIQQALLSNELTRAHLLLSEWRNTDGLSPARQSEINALLSDLAGTVVYSMEHRLEPPHQVQPGETLATIAQQYNVPWELLAKINGVATAEAVQPGQVLKVLRGPFTADVRLDRGEIVLLIADRYAGRFPIRVSGTQPTEGQWRLDQKKLEPPSNARYASATTFKRKLMLSNPATGQTIELSDAPAPAPGANSMLAVASADLADLYDILSVGSQVTIIR